MDLWWNVELEKQAFARIHRIGQIKETHCVRIVAKGTVDEQIVKLQEAKQKNINEIFGAAADAMTNLPTEGLPT